MKKRTSNTPSAIAAALLSWGLAQGLVGCTSDERPAPFPALEGAAQTPGPWYEVNSHAASFVVRFRATPWPLVAHQLLTLDVLVREVESTGTALALDFDATMPAHRHGMTTAPQVTTKSPGEFRVDGVLLHMPGAWTFHFDVGRGGLSERAIWSLDLPYGLDPEESAVLSLSPLGAVPPDPTNRFADDPRAVALGARLFTEDRWSANGEISCATCHDPERHFTDGKALGEGLAPLTRHTPTLWNVGYLRWWFWDGRADSLWSQAVQPLLHPDELGASEGSVYSTVHDDESLRTAYDELFGSIAGHEPADVLVNVGKSLAAYQRTLVLADSPFDRYVAALRREDEAGARTAMSPAAQRGLELFVGRAQCIVCHHGPLLTDGEFHDVLLAEDPAVARDAGRYAGIEELLQSPYLTTSKYSDAPRGEAARRVRFLQRSRDSFGQFRTPSLRNVALTPPYMHDGRFETLDEVLHHYSTLEGARAPHHPGETILQPLDLNESERGDLLAFLHALSGNTESTAAGNR